MNPRTRIAVTVVAVTCVLTAAAVQAHHSIANFWDGSKRISITGTVTAVKLVNPHSEITLQVNGSEIDVDSRPSDALALAVRTSAPIFVADQVIDDSAIEFGGESEDEAEVVDEFKKFLENVNPDDFAG